MSAQASRTFRAKIWANGRPWSCSASKTKGRCNAQRPNVWHDVMGLAADQINIATAQTDIVKFTIGQAVQRLAGDAG